MHTGHSQGFHSKRLLLRRTVDDYLKYFRRCTDEHLLSAENQGTFSDYHYVNSGHDTIFVGCIYGDGRNAGVFVNNLNSWDNSYREIGSRLSKIIWLSAPTTILLLIQSVYLLTKIKRSYSEESYDPS